MHASGDVVGRQSPLACVARPRGVTGLGVRFFLMGRSGASWRPSVLARSRVALIARFSVFSGGVSS